MFAAAGGKAQSRVPARLIAQTLFIMWLRSVIAVGSAIYQSKMTGSMSVKRRVRVMIGRFPQ